MASSTHSHVTARTESGVLVLTIMEKQLTGEDLCDAIREELVDAVQQGTSKVIVDFAARRVCLQRGLPGSSQSPSPGARYRGPAGAL